MKRSILLLSAILCFVSCSTTKVLQEGQCRLESNKIEVLSDKHFKEAELSPYLKQQPNHKFLFGWNPFLYMYNWSGTKSQGWNRFFKALGEAPVVFDESLVKESEYNLTKHLEFLGYYGSSVTSEIKYKGAKARVLYTVTLGKRYPIEDIEYSLPSDPEFRKAFEENKGKVSIKKGDLLSESILEKESTRAENLFRSLGYYNFNSSLYSFVADTVTIPGKVILKYNIEDRDIHKYRIGDVSITHSKNLPFRESVLKKFNQIKPGQVYNSKTVENTYYKLSSLKIFNGVGIEMTEEGDSTINCMISLKNAQPNGFKVKLESSVTSSGLIGISPKLSFYNRNLFHGGELFSLSFDGNFQFKFNNNTKANEFGVSANLSLPMAKGPSFSDIKLAYNYHNRPEYKRNMISGGFGFSGSTKGKLFYQVFPIQLNVVNMSHISPSFQDMLNRNPFLKYSYQDHFDEGLGASIYHTTDANVVPASSYSFQRLNVDVSGNVLSLASSLMPVNEDGARLIFGMPFTQYVRAELNIGSSISLDKNDKHKFASRLSFGVGYAYGNSTTMPYEKQFYCGGSSSMRAWQARSLGPADEPINTSFIIPSQTGNFKIEADIEYRMKLFWKFEGAIFSEVGNVYNTLENFYKYLAADWGAGLRLNFGLILLRLDLGMKIYDPARAEGQRWVGPDKWFKSNGYALHFGVGYPF